MNPVRLIGALALDLMAGAGRFTLFALESLWHGIRPPYFFRVLGRQLAEIGWFSLPVVGLTTLFTGMVLTLQSHTGFSRFAAEDAVANVVVLALTRELAPVLAGLMVAGRVGGAMAAEIGTMRVTEQIDALVTLSTDPLRYLVAPRLIAGILVLPPLVLVGDVIGMLGAWLVATGKLGFDSARFLTQSWNFIEPLDVTSGLVKAALFGFLVTLSGCYFGYHSQGGARGVGQATTRAVVTASVLILFFDFLLTEAFFSQ